MAAVVDVGRYHNDSLCEPAVETLLAEARWIKFFSWVGFILTISAKIGSCSIPLGYIPQILAEISLNIILLIR